MSPIKKRAEAVQRLLGAGVLESRWLRRLSRISFLGTLDLHPRSRRASNRYEHSVAVAHLGLQVAAGLDLDRETTRTLVMACLLHDVGHYPMSHAAEPAFAKALGADHHAVTRWIVTGAGPLGAGRSLRGLIERSRVDPDAVWSLMDGEAEDALAALVPLLRGRINLDTLEGIHRVARDFRLRPPRTPEAIFGWCQGELVITKDSLPWMDDFWGLKDRVYSRVINLPSNVLAEARLCELVTATVRTEVLQHLDRFDDATFIEGLGADWSRVRLQDRDDERYRLQPRPTDGQVLVRMRKRYYVDKRVRAGVRGLRARDWGRRYHHVREPAYLISTDRQLELPGMSEVALPVYEEPTI